MSKKRNAVPYRQNTHDLLVGTISIGIPSALVKKYIFFSLFFINYPN